MLIVALVLAVIGLAALVTAVVTSNEVVAWVCIGASSLGVVLLIVDAIRERQDRRVATPVAAGAAGGATTEVIEAVESAEVIEVIEAVESAEVIEAVESAESVEVIEAVDVDLDDSEEAVLVEDHPEEVVHDEPDYDTYSDDEQEFPQPAEEAALHIIDEEGLDEQDLDEEDLDEQYDESVAQRGDR